ncbi:glutathione S-transferase kappa 1-like [Mytilus trossulus]|uniref:glutathione S-transferase kappa 1-like n=1 Tax=Mytilus trossulus TaxID=6551 RepID=UPI00300575E4
MSSPLKKSVELFYDVVSPYSWVAFEVLVRYKTIWTNIDLKLKPVFLGGLIHESGNRSPVYVVNKGKYNFRKDIPRLARYYQIPIRIPKNPSIVMFEKTSLTAMRFLTAINTEHPEYTEKLSRELWVRAWSRDEGIFDKNDLMTAAKMAGIDEVISERALDKVTDDGIKKTLRAVTNDALNHGAFGVPTIVVYINNKPEIVFGSGRFPILATLLEEEWKGPQNHMSFFKPDENLNV